MYARLAPEHLAPEQFRTVPLPAYALPHAEPLAVCPRPPRLLRTYLSVGSKICGPPALDREFGTIDFLTLIDLAAMPAATSARFFS
jgi:putative hemolysin